MSSNAAGVPQAFLRTVRPVRFPLVDLEAHWMLGALTESIVFDHDDRNDLRSLSAAVVTLRPHADSGLVVGAARSVYAPVRHFNDLAAHLIDVLIEWQQTPTPERASSRADQLYSLFARWAVPGPRLAIHAEWAKLSLPKSLREALVNPQGRQGFTVGFEWAQDLPGTSALHVVGEATTVEQTPPAPGADVPEFYTSYSVPQGYTQRGQVLGASIGPGSSSQYLGVRLLRSKWQVLVDAERIRWEEGAFYRSPARFTKLGHDVSIVGGLTARHDGRWAAVEVGLHRTWRLNYLFQTIDPYHNDPTGDVRNTSLNLRVQPHF